MLRAMWIVVVVHVLGLLPVSTSAARLVTCQAHDEKQLKALFDAWAADVHSGDSNAVARHYTRRALLRPDPPGRALRSAKARQGYFQAWLARRPSVEVVKRHVTLKCNSVIEAGSYAVRFGDGSHGNWRYEMTHDWDGKHWLISKHLVTPLPTPD